MNRGDVMIRIKDAMLHGLEHGTSRIRQQSYSNTLFNRFFNRLDVQQKPLEILSIHEKLPLLTKLISKAPESSSITHIRGKLRDFRGKQRFDLLFYSYQQHTDINTVEFLENLCYCKMLLRPGAYIFLTVPQKETGLSLPWLAKKAYGEASRLRQAGYVNIMTQKIGKNLFLIGGQRPVYKF